MSAAENMRIVRLIYAEVFDKHNLGVLRQLGLVSESKEAKG
jgi:hypothetical protein